MAVAKGVQGAAAVPVQDFKDSGRVIKVYQAVFTATVAEGLVSLVPVTDGVAGAAGTSFTVTAGKRFRVQALLLSITNATAAIHACEITLRMTATGVVAVGSAPIAIIGCSTAAATASLSASAQAVLPDGVELSGTMQFGVSQNGIALAGQTVILIGYEY